MFHFIFKLDESTRRGLIAEDLGSQFLLCFSVKNSPDTPFQRSMLILPIAFNLFVNSINLVQ